MISETLQGTMQGVVSDLSAGANDMTSLLAQRVQYCVTRELLERWGPGRLLGTAQEWMISDWRE